MARLEDEIGVLLTREQGNPVPVIGGAQEARVVAVGADGLIRFTVPDFSPDYAFDGARWTRPRGATGSPPPGTLCLVQFVDNDLSRPWVVAWWGWGS